ncbi:flavin reductase family protein [Zoogloea sp.]|uniref:flavin reductase family protein n=1 Tax=Zoogloea sp. TaxID=49181 RepID=UPI0035AD91C1
MPATTSQPIAAHRAPFDGRLFRRVLGLFPTGVTIVTTWDDEGRPVGATVSSFNSVSLDPPLVLFSLAKNMACCEAFAAGGPLAIHVLGDEQESLSNRFARGGGDKWVDLVYGAGEHGAPLIDGALATFECRPFAQYPGGDHTIFVAEVSQLRFREGEPLVFACGSYRRLAEREVCA